MCVCVCCGWVGGHVWVGGFVSVGVGVCSSCYDYEVGSTNQVNI